ncbi:MAG: MATE family efflux transporter [Firmicutes bacterium]|jgi:putative MATE family efflux protein|nr:MATE family efflux transporter [Bacillota bacterium]
MQQGHGIRDFTTGDVMGHLIRFSIPLFLGNVLQALYNTVDSVWVGRFLGREALGAVSLSFPITFTLISLAVGFSTATTVLVSQYFGAGDVRMVRRTVFTSVAFIGSIGVAMSLVGLAAHRPILRLIDTPGDVMDMASGYLAIYSSGLVFTFLYNVLGAIYRGLGDSRTPVTVLAYATVLNMILDPLMIFGVFPFPRMEVAGAAWATVISQALSVVLLFAFTRSVAVSPGRGAPAAGTSALDWSLVRPLVRIGLPAGAQQALVALSGVTVSWIVNSFGSAVLAAYGAGVRLDQFALMPSMSISMAVSALTGQNMGAGRLDRVKETVAAASGLASAIAACVSAVALGLPGVVLSLFTADPEVMAVGTVYLRVVALSYIPFALMFVTNGVIRGAGDTLPTMLNTLASLWLVRVPLAWALSRIPRLGSTGIWVGIALGQVAGMALSRAYYATGRWKGKAVAQRLPGEPSPPDP